MRLHEIERRVTRLPAEPRPKRPALLGDGGIGGRYRRHWSPPVIPPKCRGQPSPRGAGCLGGRVTRIGQSADANHRQITRSASFSGATTMITQQSMTETLSPILIVWQLP